MVVEKKYHGKKSTYEQQVEQHMAYYLLRNVAEVGKTLLRNVSEVVLTCGKIFIL